MFFHHSDTPNTHIALARVSIPFDTLAYNHHNHHNNELSIGLYMPTFKVFCNSGKWPIFGIHRKAGISNASSLVLKRQALPLNPSHDYFDIFP